MEAVLYSIAIAPVVLTIGIAIVLLCSKPEGFEEEDVD